MSALLYKAWLETRVRFLTGLTAVAIVCIFHMEQHAGLLQMWTRDFQTHNFSRSIWARLGVPEYGWYLWRYLYDNYLQQVWVLFAVLLAFDGLIREKAGGTVLFSLGLPVSRKRWLFTRLAVVVMESAALSLFAVLVLIAGSAVIHQTYSLSQVFLHAALMVAAGVFVIALGNLCYTLFPGNYQSLLVTLILMGIPYLWLQLHVQRMRALSSSYFPFTPAAMALMRARLHAPLEPPPSWLGYFDVAHVMAGPWQLSWTTAPWAGLLGIWTLTLLVVAVTVAYGDRVDY